MAKKSKYEGSTSDLKMDKKGMKEMGMSAKQWEGSAADKKADKAGAKKMRKGK